MDSTVSSVFVCGGLNIKQRAGDGIDCPGSMFMYVPRFIKVVIKLIYNRFDRIAKHHPIR
jgi:hypothetical protein